MGNRQSTGRLSVLIIAAPLPVAQDVPLATLREKAQLVGNPVPPGRTPAGVTVPTISVDLTGLRFEQRRGAQENECRFDQGVLRLTISNQIYMLNTLGPCPRRLWEAHERDHVRDYENLMEKIDEAIRSDAALKPILIDRQWLPSSSFGFVQRTIIDCVGAVFARLTRQASQGRDTAAEYARVEREIRSQCGSVGPPHTGGPPTGQKTVGRGEASRP